MKELAHWDSKNSQPTKTVLLAVNKMSHPKATLIISFFNNFPFLKLVLGGLERQTVKDFEIIIADDGSNEECKRKIMEYDKNSTLNIKHQWHKDEGWQKNRILNQAIVASKTNYLVFIDGDCIPHRAFIEEHISNRKIKTALAGRRVNLSEEVSSMLNYENVKDGYLEKRLFPIMVWGSIRGRGNRIENGIYFKSTIIRKIINKKERGILGSNFSLFKKDIVNINGFDERYRSPAVGEDTDIEYRLRNNGILIKSIKHLSIQYHLFHEKLYRTNKNLEILKHTMEKKIVYTPFGINKQFV